MKTVIAVLPALACAAMLLVCLPDDASGIQGAFFFG